MALFLFVVFGWGTDEKGGEQERESWEGVSERPNFPPQRTGLFATPFFVK